MNKYLGLAMVPVGIGLNIVGGLIATTFRLPIFLDTIGTMLVAAILGPWWGALTGGLSNVIMSLSSPMDAWFAIVNVIVGLVVGFASRRWGFRRWPVVLGVGLVLAIVCPAVGSVIAAYVYGGLTGGGLDIFVGGLLLSGSDIFTAAFLPRIGANLVDKLLSVVVAMLVVRALPRSLQGLSAGPQPAS